MDCNNQTFGDPNPGVKKACWVRGAQPERPDAGKLGKRCAPEGGRCNFRGKGVVSSGAKGKFAKRVAYDGTACNNRVFGDPVPGVRKACLVYQEPAVAPPPPPAEGPRGAKRCATEGQRCRFRGEGVVFYGAQGKWARKTARGGIGCNNGVFGDPIRGVKKACYVKRIKRAKRRGAGPQGSRRCATEGERCNFRGRRLVFYGAQGKWVRRHARDGVSCTNGGFGDPIRGVKKACYVK